MSRDFDLVKLSHFHIASKNNLFEIRISQGMIERLPLHPIMISCSSVMT